MRAVVVLPTYNERDNIEPYLRSLRAVSADIDVLVVDDNSPDGTADLARTLADELGGVDGAAAHREGRTRQRLPRRLPPGARSRRRAYDVVISMDADLSHDPAVIPTMLALIDGRRRRRDRLALRARRRHHRLAGPSPAAVEVGQRATRAPCCA